MVGTPEELERWGIAKRIGKIHSGTDCDAEYNLFQAFFRPAQLEDNKLNGYTFESGPVTGAPIFLDAPAWFECQVTDLVRRGDHTVVVAEVVEAGVRDPDATPMALRDTTWHYGG